MGLQTIFSHKLGVTVALVVAAAFFLVAPAAEATSYYYPHHSNSYHGYQPYYYYQQPVYQYSSRKTVDQYLSQIQSLQKQLESLQKRYNNLYGGSYSSYGGGYYKPYSSRSSYDVEVDTERARNIDDDEATLVGDVDLDNASYATVWFEYGEDSDLDDRSKKKKVTRDGEFRIDVDDLDDDERYYFRAVAEDPRGYRSYGRIRSFEADDYRSYRSDDDEPDVETGDADDIDDDSAEIEGEVDMNDFDNGDVFFVWGEDEDAVEDVEDEDEYADVDEDGDDLQKHRVYTNLDGERSFWLTIWGLDEETDYYYRICVEYEDDDDDETLECGDVEDFETDD